MIMFLFLQNSLILNQGWAILVLEGHCPACLNCFSAQHAFSPSGVSLSRINVSLVQFHFLPLVTFTTFLSLSQSSEKSAVSKTSREPLDRL